MAKGFYFHIIGAGRGGTGLLAGLLDAHPQCEVHPEEFSIGFLMGRVWTPAEHEANPAERIPIRVENFMAACERKAAEFPGLKWGHKTTTEQIAGLEDIHPESYFATDPLASPSRRGFDSLDFFLKRVAEIRTIFILRDGRTCIPSKVRRTGQPVAEAVRRWKYSVRVLAAMRATFPHLHVVKLEDLLRQPEEHLRAICDFVEVPFEAEMLLGTRSNKMLPDYRRDGFDTSVVDISNCKEEWVDEIRAELIECKYAVPS